MTRKGWAHAAGLFAVILLTVPPLARLCVGRTPSLLAPANTPFWERRAPRPLPRLGARAIAPAPPGAVAFADVNWRVYVFQTDENALLRPLEHPDADTHGDAGAAGRWLSAACVLGRTDPILRAKQERVASRILATQFSDGTFGRQTVNGKPGHVNFAVQADTLRGLLAFYQLTHDPPALYAALSCAQVLTVYGASAGRAACLLLPLSQVYQLTGDVQLLRFCRRLAVRADADSAGLCALYDVTGQHAWLARASALWLQRTHAGHADTSGAAALWSATGNVRYANALRLCAVPVSCPLQVGSLAYRRVPRGISVNVWGASTAAFGVVRLTQAAFVDKQSVPQVTFTVRVGKPTAFLLSVPPCASVAALNGKPVAFAGTLLRRWHDGDTLTVRVP